MSVSLSIMFATRQALDIGPRTLEAYKAKVKESNTAIWNGPMDVFAMTTYSTGTFAIAEVMGNETDNRQILTIIGGGDSASAAEISGHAKPNVACKAQEEVHHWSCWKTRCFPALPVLTTSKPDQEG